MRLSVVICLAIAAAVIAYQLVDLGRLGAWAVEAQRGFQNQMAAAVLALKAGDTGAYLALLGGTGAYGFVHALGPGHGKYLVGGVGLGTGVSPVRLVGLATMSSLAQALWAIVLVYGGFFLLELTAHQMTDLVEDYLAPASYLAIAAVGLVIVWRGVRATRTASSHRRFHAHDSDCGHAHSPTPEQAAQATSLREAAALVLSIAIRPCTGAIFVLVIAWQMEIRLAGALAVIVMGIGTAGLTSLVSVSSVAARSVALASSRPFSILHMASPVLQVFAGVIIILISLTLLGFAV